MAATHYFCARTKNQTMAFIPDNALDRYDELQPASQMGYSFICRHRNHYTGVSPKTLDNCAAKYGWSRATKFNVQKELTENGWIEKADGGIRPLVGDFSPVDKSKNLDSGQGTKPNESKNLDSDTEKSKILDSNEQNQSKNLDFLPDPEAESLKIWTEKSKNLDSHIRNNQLRNQQEETKETSKVLDGEQTRACEAEIETAVAVVIPETESPTNFKTIFLDGIAKILSVKSVPQENEWFTPLMWAYREGFRSEHALRVYALMKKQRWRKAPISAKEWQKNLTNLENLRKEIEEENGNEQLQRTKSNQSKFKSSGEKREQRAVDEHLAIERVREANRASRKLRSGGAGSRE